MYAADAGGETYSDVCSVGEPGRDWISAVSISAIDARKITPEVKELARRVADDLD